MPRGSRRVRTDPVPGADPAPQSRDPRPGEVYGVRPDPVVAAEDRPDAWGDAGQDVLSDGTAAGNAARLEADRPPHYA